MPRFLKQILYGLFYLSIISALGWVIWITRPAEVATCTDGIQNQDETGVDCGGICVNCELRDLRLLIGNVDAVAVGDKTSFVVTVENPSSNFGALKIPYEFIIMGRAGDELGAAKGVLNIGPKEKKKIAVVGFNASKDIIREVTFHLEDFAFISKAELPQYDIEIKNATTTFPEQVIETRGLITNNAGIVMSEVAITAFFYSPEGSLVNIGGANIANLQAFETRDFLISVPKAEGFIDTDLTEIVWRAS